MSTYEPSPNHTVNIPKKNDVTNLGKKLKIKLKTIKLDTPRVSYLKERYKPQWI